MADAKISALTETTTLADADEMVVASSGATKKITGANVKAQVLASSTFTDHSARHENGGADEISLAGLSGTPEALQTHLDDTTDAHDASAISFVAGGTIVATDVQAAISEVASDAASALSTHEADTTSVHGITDTSTLYRSGGTDVALADGGTGASLTDPNADRIMFWDDSDGAVTWLTPSTGLTITTTSLTTTVAPDGWADAGETWTFAAADSPTFTFTISGDVTSKYSAGMRVKLTQTTVKYFIITAVSYSAPNTTVTVYGGTDYTLANATISSPYYSTHKAPQGFPLDPLKWTIETNDVTNRQQATPVQNTWYNPGSLTISIPIGSWDVYYKATVLAVDASSSVWHVETTLSTANNSESEDDFTAAFYAGPDTSLLGTASARKTLTLAAKTTYYANLRTQSSGLDNIYLYNDWAPLIIRATCAYL